MPAHTLHRRLVAATLTAVLAAGLGAGNAAAAHAAPAPLAGSAGMPGSSAYLDELGRPTPYLQQRVTEIATHPLMPDDIRNALLTGLAFTTGTGETGGPDLPHPATAPTFTQFYWPTVSGGCIGGGGDSVASAIAVPGPAEIPAPGARDGQTAFLFTALGTAPAARHQGGLVVHWLNIDTVQFGSTALTNHGINPDGPATVSGVADTGKGTVVAVVGGDLRTTDNTCSFLPTAAVIDAR